MHLKFYVVYYVEVGVFYVEPGAVDGGEDGVSDVPRGAAPAVTRRRATRTRRVSGRWTMPTRNPCNRARTLVSLVSVSSRTKVGADFIFSSEEWTGAESSSVPRPSRGRRCARDEPRGLRRALHDRGGHRRGAAEAPAGGQKGHQRVQEAEAQQRLLGVVEEEGWRDEAAVGSTLNVGLLATSYLAGFTRLNCGVPNEIHRVSS